MLKFDLSLFVHCLLVSHVPSCGELVDGVYAANCQACGHFFKTRAVPTPKSQFSFTVNGQSYTGNKGYLI